MPGTERVRDSVRAGEARLVLARDEQRVAGAEGDALRVRVLGGGRRVDQDEVVVLRRAREQRREAAPREQLERVGRHRAGRQHREARQARHRHRGAEVGAALVLSVFVLIGNPLIVLAIMGAMGYRKRTGFLAGLTVAQISEFSLIFMAMGVSIGHVSDDALGLVTLVGLITIAASTYMITYSHQLYRLCEPWLGIFERGGPRADDPAGGRAWGQRVTVKPMSP